MKNNYSISEFVQNIFSLGLTKLTMKQARFIRRPVYIRGKKSIVGANNLTTGHFCRFDLPGNKDTLYIGKNCEMGDMTHVVAYNHVEIGDNVLIASKCFISDTNHGSYKGSNQDKPTTAPNSRALKYKDVKIGNNVWIGENVVILAGAHIGNGCIIGANSVVTRDIPDESIVVGNNNIIKKWNNQKEAWEHV